MKNISDIEVIESVLKGNISDYSILVDRYKNRAFSLLKRMIKNEMEAEEVLQDCFLKAFNGLSGFKKESKFSTWFYRIVYNSALTRLSLKKRKFESEIGSLEDYLNIAGEESEEGKYQELKETVQKMVEKLPERNSAVVTMYYLNEMSCEEISEITGDSVANVKVLLHRSRNLLKEIVKRYNCIEELR
jgi:RNA polymerase sigma factor (sigma-70 family)